MFCLVLTPCALNWTGSPHILSLPLQDVALVELGQSDSDERDSENDSDSEDESDSDSDGCSEITEQNLKLPGQSDEKKKKVNIEVVSQQGKQDD